MRLVVLQNDAMIADVVCGQEAVYLGASESCRVQLSDPRVAAQQAVIFPDGDGGWQLQILDTTCQVSVNEATIGGKTALRSGDEIRIVEYLVRAYPEYEDPGAGRTSGTSRAALERFAQSKLPIGAVLKRPTEPLALAFDQLDRLGRANVAVSGSLTVEQFMDAALHNLLASFAAQRAWIGIRRVNYGPMEYEEGRLLTGQPTDMHALAEELKPRILDRSHFVMVPVVSAEDPTSMLAGPLLGPDGPLGMVVVDTGESGRRFDQKELDAFVVQLNVLAYQLDAILQTLARNRIAMIDGQVSVTHETQARLTPRKLPQSERLQFGAFRETGHEHAGDIYDVVKLASGNVVGVLIAHTPAAGALPAILMTQVQTAFRYAAMHQDAPHVLLRSLNWMLYDGRSDHPMACFVGYIDADSGQVRYAIAGELGAFIIGTRGEERPLVVGDTPPPALGMAKATAYEEQREQLQESETLALFTPGVTTAKSRSGETFGRERFVDILCDGFGQSAGAMLKEMLTDLQNFTEGGAQPQDITVVLAHRP
jgi:serine phosphatase RsbU (regulator of sigma subunit)